MAKINEMTSRFCAKANRTLQPRVAARRLRIASGTLLMGLTIVAPYGAAQTEGPAFATIYNFTGAPSGCGTTGQPACDGATPDARVLTGANGVLYGTTQTGGTANGGTVFELRPPASPGGAWTETVIYSFPADSDPSAALTAGQNGELYGTTYYGGGGWRRLRIISAGHSGRPLDGDHPVQLLVPQR
jgi:hypothetical protein